MAERFNQQGQVPQAPAPQPQPSYQPVDDNDFVTGGVVKQYVDQVARQVSPALQQSLAQQAAMAHYIARKEHTTAFDKYGPEIEAELSRLPAEARTLDNIKVVVDLVRGRHVDDLVEERARELAATMGQTLRSNGGTLTAGPVSPSLQNPTVPDEWRRKALAVGLDDAAVADFCRANYMTTQQFYDQFSKGQIAAAVAENNVDRRSTLNTLRG